MRVRHAEWISPLAAELGWSLTRYRPGLPRLQPCPVNQERAPWLTDQSARARWPLSGEAPTLARSLTSSSALLAQRSDLGDLTVQLAPPLVHHQTSDRLPCSAWLQLPSKIQNRCTKVSPSWGYTSTPDPNQNQRPHPKAATKNHRPRTTDQDPKPTRSKPHTPLALRQRTGNGKILGDVTPATPGQRHPDVTPPGKTPKGPDHSRPEPFRAALLYSVLRVPRCPEVCAQPLLQVLGRHRIPPGHTTADDHGVEVLDRYSIGPNVRVVRPELDQFH